MANYETVWSFETAHFTVKLQVCDETMDPADSFQFDEDIEMVRNGDVLWFGARCVVEFDGVEVGDDFLGGCAYHDIDEFLSGHRDRDPMNRNCSVMRAQRGQNVVICHYFPGMVSAAIADARKTLAKARATHVRR